MGRVKRHSSRSVPRVLPVCSSVLKKSSQSS